jgi:predicted glycosyltransferase
VLRIWVDMTAPAHPVVFRPIIRILRERGHEVEVTARDYAQNIPLLERMGMEHTMVGPGHGGASTLGKARALAARTRAMRRFGRGRRFDLAVAHGSNDLALAAASLRIPAVNTFDYEFAIQQHNIGCRLARRVMTPDAIPPQRLERFGVGPGKLVQYAGLKEEYYLADFAPDHGELDRLGVERERVIVIVRPPPEVTLYHRLSNELFPRVLERLGRDPGVHAVVIPRTAAQREAFAAAALPSVILPAGAVDAQSLIALGDLVVSAGGTMNREAVALATPVYTTFAGRLGGVDEQLLRAGRLRRLADPEELALVKQGGEREIARRDPSILADIILGTVP